jgi:hypothetical protein
MVEQMVTLKCKLCKARFKGIPDTATDPYAKLSDHLLTAEQDKVFDVVEVAEP